MNIIKISVREFLSLHFNSWVELHWSLISTDEKAEEVLRKLGYTGIIYKVPFGWWCPVS